ncbi:RadC family protein [Verrucomicrobiota bacterium sgz303538]
MGSLTIHELPEQERPRERLAAVGAVNLSDSELIAIILRTGMKGVSAIDLGRELLVRFGSLSAMARCDVHELAKVKGVGLTKAIQLAAAFGLATRVARESLARQKIDSPELVYALLGSEMRSLAKESLRVVLLDTKYHLLRIHQVSLGSLNESVAHPREIFQPALTYSAYAFILVHNHPSGDPSPSEADRRLTVRLNEGARLLQIQMLDHVIIGTADNGRQPYFSFREAGLI